MGTAKKAGYLDDVFNVLDANKHPCIIMGRFALKWMGCGVFSEEVSDRYSALISPLISSIPHCIAS